MKYLSVLALLIMSVSMTWAQGYSSDLSQQEEEINSTQVAFEEDIVMVEDLSSSQEDVFYYYEEDEWLASSDEYIETVSTSNEEESDDEDPLARAYYLVGEQYKKVGKPNKGKTFIDRAYKLDPSLDPNDINNSSHAITLSSKEQAARSFNFSSVNSSVNNYPENEQSQVALILFQFDRFTRGLLSENINVIESLLDESVQINDQYFDKSDMLEAFNYIFDKGDLSQLTLSDLYKKEPVVILLPNGGIIKIEAREQSILKTLPFWRENQEIYFIQRDGYWYITKILTDIDS